MAEAETVNGVKEENKLWKGVFAVSGIMFTLVIYGLLQVCFLSCHDTCCFCSMEIQLKVITFFVGFVCKCVVGEDNESSLWIEQRVL